jgi:hypothetical protein
MIHGLLVGVAGLTCGCEGSSSSEADTKSVDAAPSVEDAASDAPLFCTWPGYDGGTVMCPADGKTTCPWSDRCNHCTCYVGSSGLSHGCSTLFCP